MFFYVYSLKIRLTFDTEARTLTVADNGIGMDKAELIENLGTIAHSGTSKLVEQLKDAQGKDAVNLIGQFGVGFYSVFMVADKVVVTTRKAGTDQGWTWTSDGRGSYAIDQAVSAKRGTEIEIHLKDEAGEYLLEERLKHIVKKYSDHINFPIVLGEGDDAPKINSGAALWMHVARIEHVIWQRRISYLTQMSML